MHHLCSGLYILTINYIEIGFYNKAARWVALFTQHAVPVGVKGDAKTPQRSSLQTVTMSDPCYFKAHVKTAPNQHLSFLASGEQGSANVD